MRSRVFWPVACFVALLSACADDAPPIDDAEQITTTTTARATTTTVPELPGLFEDTESWAAGWFDGEPILDGPWISPGGPGIAAPITVGGCVLGSEFPLTVTADGVIVDETQPLVEYDCSEPRIPEDTRRALIDFIFSDPGLELSPHRLELLDDDHSLTFTPVPDFEDLEGDWKLVTIDGTPVENALALHFRPAAEFGGVAELRLCDQVFATARYSRTTVGGVADTNFDVFCTDPAYVGNGEIDSLQTLVAEPADVRWIAEDELEVFDGTILVSLER